MYNIYSLDNSKKLFLTLALHSLYQSTDNIGFSTLVNSSSSQATELHPGTCNKYGSWLLVFRYDI